MKTIIFSGEVGIDIRPAAIREELKKAGGDAIEAHFSSPGGLVFAAIEIYNLLRDYKRAHPGARMVSVIKSIAASAGSYLALGEAFDGVLAEDNSTVMIHGASGAISGPASEHAKMAETLEKIDDLMADAYAKRSGKSKAEIRREMSAETWLFGQEIKNAGFADEILTTGAVTNKAAALSRAHALYSACVPRIQQDIAAHAGSLGLAGSVLLGLDIDGKPFYSSSVRSRPNWFLQMSGLTEDGRAALEIVREYSPGLYIQAMENILSDDGVIRSGADVEREKRRLFGANYKPRPPLPVPDSLDGVIRTDADLEAAIARGR